MASPSISTAVWVGLIAVAGVATQTVIVVVVYLDQAIRAAQHDEKLGTVEDLQAAVVAGDVSLPRRDLDEAEINPPVAEHDRHWLARLQATPAQIDLDAVRVNPISWISPTTNPKVMP